MTGRQSRLDCEFGPFLHSYILVSSYAISLVLKDQIGARPKITWHNASTAGAICHIFACGPCNWCTLAEHDDLRDCRVSA